MILATHRIEERLAAVYDRWYSPQQMDRFERFIARISVASFIIHLLLVFLARTVPTPGVLLTAIGRNYLSAIYTPFSFILFYEAMMLITALPKSTTQSIAKQFEIVSLIYIRKFFKNIAHLDGFGELTRPSREVVTIFADVAAGLLMFFLVVNFFSSPRRRYMPETPGGKQTTALVSFIARKKVIAAGLTATLLGLAFYNLVEYIVQVYAFAHAGAALPDPNTFFYSGLFEVMIFTDVLLVILSLRVSDRYELVFRNEAFVISTILLRFSLTAGTPYAALLAIGGMLFGIVSLLIYERCLGKMLPAV